MPLPGQVVSLYFLALENAPERVMTCIGKWLRAVSSSLETNRSIHCCSLLCFILKPTILSIFFNLSLMHSIFFTCYWNCYLDSLLNSIRRTVSVHLYMVKWTSHLVLVLVLGSLVWQFLSTSEMLKGKTSFYSLITFSVLHK